MTKSRKPPHNQISENIYCNSGVYDIIFDANVWFSELQRMKPPIDAVLNHEMPFFSQFLEIDLDTSGGSNCSTL